MQLTRIKILEFPEKIFSLTKNCPVNRLAQEVERMKNGFITFRSVTYAQRGEGVLRRVGFNARMQRTPKWMEEQGCGYCLRLPAAELSDAVRVLQGQSVDYRRVYLRREDGVLEEWKL